MSDIDFRLLPQDGIEFEQMVRDLFVALRVRAAWSGRGPDDGKDLIAEEEGDDLFGRKIHRWLVSCKHFAHAGRAVSADDLEHAVDRCQQHGCTGFLLACSTEPSAACVRAIEGLEANNNIVCHYWDGPILRQLLSRPEALGVRTTYFGRDAPSWEVAPFDQHLAVVNVGDHQIYLGLRNREGDDGTSHRWQYELGIEHLAQKLPDDVNVRVRALYYDDKNCNYAWYLDLFADDMTWLGDRASIERHLSQVLVQQVDWGGQWHDFWVRIHEHSNEGSDELREFVNSADLRAIETGSDWNDGLAGSIEIAQSPVAPMPRGESVSDDASPASAA